MITTKSTSHDLRVGDEWRKPGDVTEYKRDTGCDYNNSMLQLEGRAAVRYLGCLFEWVPMGAHGRQHRLHRCYKFQDPFTEQVIDIEWCDTMQNLELLQHIEGCMTYDLAKIRQITQVLDTEEPFIWVRRMGRSSEYSARLVRYDEYGDREVIYGDTRSNQHKAIDALLLKLQSEYLLELNWFNSLQVVKR